MNTWEQSIQKDVDDLKKEVKDLKKVTSDHERDIRAVQETLREIKDDTKWLRRTITNAILMTVLSAIVGGIATIVFGAIRG